MNSTHISVWWQELIRRISQIPDDEFWDREDEVVQIIDSAIADQLRAKSEGDVRLHLVASLNDVKEWLSTPDSNRAPAGHYFAAYFNSWLGFSPLKFADIPRPPAELLPLEIDLPERATLERGDRSCTFSLPGMTVQILMLHKQSLPTLGLLVERGDDALLQSFIEGGVSKKTAARRVREAKTVLSSISVSVSDVSLGKCQVNYYTYDSTINKVHHYCLLLDGQHINVTATQFPSADSLDALEKAIATLRLQVPK